MASPKSGDCIVVLLDILGARTFDNDVTSRLHADIDYLRERVKVRTQGMLQQGKEFIDHLPKPRFMAFGDTLLFLWEVGEHARWLPIVGQLFSGVFVDALERGVALRGAVSYGQAKCEGDVALGPAISDAAAWFEEVDAMAVVVTPRTGLLLDDIEMQWGARKLGRAFIKQEELKMKRSNDKIILWAISWPAAVYEHAHGQGICGSDIRRLVLSRLQRYAMPPGTERKYYEALRLFDRYEAMVSGSAESGELPSAEEGTGV